MNKDAGMVTDVPVGGCLTIEAASGQRITVSVLPKTGRRARLRVQSAEKVGISSGNSEKTPAEGCNPRKL